MCAAIRSACDVRLDGLDVLGANRLFLQCSDKAVCQLRREEVHEEEGVVEGPLCAEDESAGEKRGWAMVMKVLLVISGPLLADEVDHVQEMHPLILSLFEQSVNPSAVPSLLASAQSLLL